MNLSSIFFIDPVLVLMDPILVLIDPILVLMGIRRVAGWVSRCGCGGWVGTPFELSARAHPPTAASSLCLQGANTFLKTADGQFVTVDVDTGLVTTSSEPGLEVRAAALANTRRDSD